MLSSTFASSYSSTILCRRNATKSTFNLPNKLTVDALSLPELNTKVLVEELRNNSGNNNIYKNIVLISTTNTNKPNKSPTTVPKMYAVLEAVSDRIEMHGNVKEQRDNWNSLLLNSVNSIILTASAISAVAAASGTSSHVVALTSCSSLLYLAATGLMVIVNKIQPSQLAEEQRNAVRLFKRLLRDIETKLSVGSPKSSDVREAMERVLALDRAYPLPLLGKMLEKFPSKVEPAKWWPAQSQSKSPEVAFELEGSLGWDEGLEERMRGVVKVLRSRDKEDYLRLGEKALKLNKMLGLAGPVLTTMAAIGSAFMGPNHSGLAAMIGVAAGGMAAVINAVEHGGQVGMVFEMYRSNAGFFELMEEWIEGSLKEKKGTNGKVMEMKVALELGRSLSELRDLADSSLNNEEFGSKLF